MNNASTAYEAVKERSALECEIFNRKVFQLYIGPASSKNLNNSWTGWTILVAIVAYSCQIKNQPVSIFCENATLLKVTQDIIGVLIENTILPCWVNSAALSQSMKYGWPINLHRPPWRNVTAKAHPWGYYFSSKRNTHCWQLHVLAVGRTWLRAVSLCLRSNVCGWLVPPSPRIYTNGKVTWQTVPMLWQS